jgi:hypothetical protein
LECPVSSAVAPHSTLDLSANIIGWPPALGPTDVGNLRALDQ